MFLLQPLFTAVSALSVHLGLNSTTEDLLDDKSKNNHQKSPSILPKFFMEDGKLVGLLPGDEGYEDH